MRLLESDTHQLGADILDIIDSLLKILASRSQTRPRHAHSYDIYRCSFLYSERTEPTSKKLKFRSINAFNQNTYN